MSVETEIAEGIRTRLWPLLSLVGDDVASMVDPRIDEAAARLAVQLNDPDDGAQTANSIVAAFDPTPEWFATELGDKCRKAAGSGDIGITQEKAAEILGVTRGTIAQMVSRGNLPRVGGHVSLRAVVARRDSRA